jgi:hypothetical protein
MNHELQGAVERAQSPTALYPTSRMDGLPYALPFRPKAIRAGPFLAEDILEIPL